MNKGKRAQNFVAKQEAFIPKNYDKFGLTEDEVLEIKESFLSFKDLAFLSCSSIFFFISLFVLIDISISSLSILYIYICKFNYF